MSGIYIKTPHSSQYVPICASCIDDHRTNYAEPGDVEMAWPIPGEGTICEHCPNDAGRDIQDLQDDACERQAVAEFEDYHQGGRRFHATYRNEWEGR